jgi:hypothetical protein
MEWLSQLDVLHGEKQFRQIHRELKLFVGQNPNCEDPEVLWRFARALYDLSSGWFASLTHP